MELSDYIGLAITSADFPIKEQIYPQFHYDFEKKLFEENRRRYVPYSESCIIDNIFIGSEKWHFEKENVAELTKYSTGDKILFVKYFDTNIIKPNLANSLGWIPNEPIPNQLRDPFLTEPTPGIKTNINNIKHVINIMLAFL